VKYFLRCLRAKRGALTIQLSLLISRYVSINVLESSDLVEVGKCMGDDLFISE
jgi:hypothetical protein